MKEALGGSGNVDHVVLTPAGVWVVEKQGGMAGQRAVQGRAAASGGER